MLDNKNMQGYEIIMLVEVAENIFNHTNSYAWTE